MAELKTRQTEASVEEFLKNIENEGRRQDSFTLVEMFRQITKAEPKMWGSSIIGFGNTHYQYESGREGDWFVVGFSPRKQSLTLYLGYQALANANLMNKLGKVKLGKGCLYINKLSDIDQPTLRELIEQSVGQK